MLDASQQMSSGAALQRFAMQFDLSAFIIGTVELHVQILAVCKRPDLF